MRSEEPEPSHPGVEMRGDLEWVSTPRLVESAAARFPAVQALVDGDPAALRSIEGRFSAPAYNGDTLRTEIWTGGGDSASARFRVRNQADQTVR